MTEFLEFKRRMQEQFALLLTLTDTLFLTMVSKDELWNTYLDSFPEEINGIFRERRHYDCNACSKFIRPYGNIVGIVNNELVSIWDFEIGGDFQVVADAMSKLVKSARVNNRLIVDTQKLGIDKNTERIGGDVVVWDHWFYKLPKALVYRGSDTLDSVRGKIRTEQGVLKRALDEITTEAVNIALELIEQKTMYRGEEYRPHLEQFQKLQKLYAKVPEEQRDNFCWANAKKYEFIVRIRNMAIGTFLVNVSADMDIDKALTKFEKVMAPDNYKRPNPVFSKKAVEQAQKKIVEMGLLPALGRRHAQITDVTVNNVLFADASARAAMTDDVFTELAKHAKKTPKKFDHVEEISVEDFLNKVMTKADAIELFLENRHSSNMVSLIAPKDPEAPSLFKWKNPFSWSYNGNVADSIKQRVKRAGGNVEGYLRISLSWHNTDDYDLHVLEPNGNHIYYSSKISPLTGGHLDVDQNYRAPYKTNAVENIAWEDPNRMLEGEYSIYVQNYSKRNAVNYGFTVEVECEGRVWSFTHTNFIPEGENVHVGKLRWTKREGVSFRDTIASQELASDLWSVSTQEFHRISTVMHSPNHWDGENVGNKHVFFMLDGCKNPEKARGFYNEFLPAELNDERKVFEALADKMKVDIADEQLSGVGFSTTKRDNVIVKVTGATERHLKIIF